MEHFFEKIKGWSSLKDQGQLINIALDELSIKNNLKIAEIGVYKGRGTAIWNVELINKNINYEYFAIDNFEGSSEHKTWGNVPSYEEALHNLEPIINKINLIKSDSLLAANSFPDNTFDIVYIDASHEYELVLADINAWYPKVKSGGILCGDDYINGWPGVIQAVNKFFFGEKKFKINKVGNQQWWVKIIKDHSTYGK